MSPPLAEIESSFRAQIPDITKKESGLRFQVNIHLHELPSWINELDVWGNVPYEAENDFLTAQGITLYTSASKNEQMVPGKADYNRTMRAVKLPDNTQLILHTPFIIRQSTSCDEGAFWRSLPWISVLHDYLTNHMLSIPKIAPTDGLFVVHILFNESPHPFHKADIAFWQESDGTIKTDACNARDLEQQFETVQQKPVFHLDMLLPSRETFLDK